MSFSPAGKSTLVQILAGKWLVQYRIIAVLFLSDSSQSRLVHISPLPRLQKRKQSNISFAGRFAFDKKDLLFFLDEFHTNNLFRVCEVCALAHEVF
jgi:predicted AAA+ superfamily ATPase